jgi:hypothetical protein
MSRSAKLSWGIAALITRPSFGSCEAPVLIRNRLLKGQSIALLKAFPFGGGIQDHEYWFFAGVERVLSTSLFTPGSLLRPVCRLGALRSRLG